jgi:hypothetical protein
VTSPAPSSSPTSTPTATATPSAKPSATPSGKPSPSPKPTATPSAKPKAAPTRTAPRSAGTLAPLAPVTTYSAAILADHPLAYYRLGEAACCVAADSSGFNQNATYAGSGIAFGAPGLLSGDPDTAISTSGVTAVSRDAGFLPGGSAARTFELWEQTTTTCCNQSLFSYGMSNATSQYFQLSIRPISGGTLLYFIGWGNDAAFNTPYAINDGRPHHIVLSWDGVSLVTFYVDGQQIGQAGLAPLGTALAAQPLEIGNGVDGAFSGTLDEFAAFAGALPADRVNAHWQAGTAASACVASPTTGYAGAVVADHPSRYFRLGDTGRAATDSSGNCRYAAYAPGDGRGAGLLLSTDNDGAISSPSPLTSMLSMSTDSLPVGARTFEVWEQTTVNGSNQALFSYGLTNATTQYFQLSLRPFSGGTTLFFTGWGDDAAFNTPYPINDGKPHQVALSYDGGLILTFYVDGQQIGQATLAGGLSTALGAQALELGNGVDGAFNGTLDEFAVYPSVVSAAELGAHWRIGQAGVCPATPTTGYAAAVAADSPYRYFRLGEAAGQVAADSSSNCRFAAYASGDAHLPGLLTGDGDGAVANGAAPTSILSVSADGLPSTGARTLEVWVQTADKNDNQALFSYGLSNATTQYFQLSIRPVSGGTLLYFTGWGDDAAFNTPYPIDDGKPHHIALAYNGGTIVTFYLDGQQIGQAGINGGLVTAIGAQALELGNGVDGAFKSGTLDEFAVYTTALSADRINAHWRAGTATTCPALPTTGYAGAVTADHPLRYFRLGETAGQAAADFSPNCRFAAYAPGAGHVTGLLTGDNDGAVSSPSPLTTAVSISPDALPSTGPRTLELWEQTLGNGNQALFSYGQTNATTQYFQLSIRPVSGGTLLYFTGWGDDAAFNTPYPINDGLPHQIALAYDGGTLVTFYVDGHRVGQAGLNGSLGTALGSQALEIGNGVDGPFTGTLDEVAIYPSALSDTRIAAHWTAGAVASGFAELAGIVTGVGSPLAGARVQACDPTAGCLTGPLTGSGGFFHIVVPNGSYTVTAFPPASAGLGPALTVGPFVVAPSQLNIAINFATPPPPSGVFSTPGSAPQQGVVPNVFWGNPSTYTVQGCIGGFGVLFISAPNTSTGQLESHAVPMVETPAGSGNYVAQLGPLAPLHGVATVQQAIACPGHTKILPDGGTPTGGTKVMLAGSGFTGATGVLFGSTPATSFQVVQDNVIMAFSPAGTGTVPVSVTLASAQSVVIGSYTYFGVTRISPTSGPVTGGTAVTITGQGFTNVHGVAFGLLKALSFTVVSPTQINAVSPEGLGTVSVQVLNGFAASDSVTGSLFTYTGGPPGSELLIEPTGTGPGPTQALAAQYSGFCGQSHAVSQQSPIDIGRACDGAQKIIDEEGPIGVLTGVFIAAAVVTALFVFGVIATAEVVLAVLPVILLVYALYEIWKMFIDPSGTVVDSSGNPVNGATVTINRQNPDGTFSAVPPGSGFIQPAVNPEITGASGGFDWDALAGTYNIGAAAPGCNAPGNPSQPGVSTPAFALPPPVVGLMLPMDCPGSTPPAPAVSDVQPNAGIAAGGTQVEIIGSGLAGATAVHFGSAPATSFKVLSPYAVLAIAPPGTGAVDVTVTTAGGNSPASAADTYSYFTPPSSPGAPTIGNVNPAGGPLAGGTLVTIEGTGLDTAFGVSFGGTPSIQITHISSTQLLALTPSGLVPGPVDVTVSGPNGSSARVAAATFIYSSLPGHGASQTTLTLGSSANPSQVGQAVTFTATVAPTDGGGSVSFYADGSATPLAGCANLALTSGAASCATATLALGNHPLSASYTGDVGFAASTGALAGGQTVNLAGPTLSTTAAPSTAIVGAGLADSAALTGAYKPGGTVTFKLYGPADTACSGTPAYSEMDAVANLVAATGTAFVSNVTGTWHWTAAYSGDTNNAAASSGCGAEPVTVAPASPSLATTPNPGVAVVGVTLNDAAGLTGGFSPTGSVTFKLYGPTDLSCSGMPAYIESAVLANGTAATVTGFASSSAGTWHWAAYYSGDAANNPASSGCAAEVVQVSKASPTLATTPNPAAAVVGTTLNDAGTVTGGFKLGGSVTFNLFAPGDQTCSGTPVFSQTQPLVNGGSSTSPGFSTSAAGTWHWTAAYAGDANNNAASSGCGAEPVTVSKASPSLSTTPNPAAAPIGALLKDSATLSGGFSPGGTMTFKLYGPGDPTCAAAPAFSETDPVSAGGAATATGFAGNALGTWHWSAAYSGDANNNLAAGGCSEVVTVSKATPSLTTTATPQVYVFEGITDTAHLGGYKPTGNLTFKVFAPGDSTCATPLTPAPTGATVNGAADYTSGTFTTSRLGAYRWIAAYAGDGNNNAATTACNDPGETSTAMRPSLVTDGSGCTFGVDPSLPGEQLSLNYSSGRLAASTPTDFYYNTFVYGSSIGGTTLIITLPYPWVTSGSTGSPPTRIYGIVGTSISGNRVCLQPSAPIGSSSGQVTLSNYGGKFGSTATLTLTLPNVPHLSFAFVQVHLAYGLMGETGCSPGGSSGNDALCTAPVPVTIPDRRIYNFSDSALGLAIVRSMNSFR